MDNNKKKINLFNSTLGSVRKVIAILLTLVFCYLSIIGEIKSDQFIPIFSMVLGYYFGKSTALDIPGKLKKENSDENIQ